MSTYEPSPAEVRLTLLAGALIAPFYAGYVNQLELKGSERVLDYGSGSGVCSKHLAARLAKGGGRLTCADVSKTWNGVLKNTLKGYANVESCVVDLSDLHAPDPLSSDPLPEGTFDALFIHFCLHDIPAHERGGITRRLASKLVAGGKLFIREPLEGDGMPAEEIRRLWAEAGLRECSGSIEAKWYTGKLYRGVYCKDPAVV